MRALIAGRDAANEPTRVPITQTFSDRCTMPKEYSRTARVGEQIQRELAVLIQQEVKDPRVGMATVSEVRVSSDLAHAKVYVTVLNGDGDEKETIDALNHAARFLRHELARRLALRTTPRLHFYRDEVMERGMRLNALIEASVEADKKKRK